MLRPEGGEPWGLSAPPVIRDLQKLAQNFSSPFKKKISLQWLKSKENFYSIIVLLQMEYKLFLCGGKIEFKKLRE